MPLAEKIIIAVLAALAIAIGCAKRQELVTPSLRSQAQQLLDSGALTDTERTSLTSAVKNYDQQHNMINTTSLGRSVATTMLGNEIRFIEERLSGAATQVAPPPAGQPATSPSPHFRGGPYVEGF